LLRAAARLLARSCKSGMSASWSLSGINRTWRGQPVSVAIAPVQTDASSADVGCSV
jgi:hypothetical protein